MFCVYVATCSAGLYHTTLFIYGSQTLLVVSYVKQEEERKGD